VTGETGGQPTPERGGPAVGHAPASGEAPGAFPGVAMDPSDARFVLLGGAVDFAGLFPPAALSMQDAVARYAEYLAGADRWALGRFVVPATSLDAFADAATPHLAPGGPPWSLSVLFGADAAADLSRVEALHTRLAGRVRADAFEVRAGSPEAVERLAGTLPKGPDVFVEIPLADDPAPLVRAIGRAALCAKARTGGVSADAFPAAGALADFLEACVSAGVRFKLTAGLHHPLRGSYPLTYAPDSPRATMYGYLNALLAVALLQQGGADRAEVLAALQESDPAALGASGGALVWRGRTFDARALGAARAAGMTGFGSCSFREPVDELALLRLS